MFMAPEKPSYFPNRKLRVWTQPCGCYLTGTSWHLVLHWKTSFVASQLFRRFAIAILFCDEDATWTLPSSLIILSRFVRVSLRHRSPHALHKVFGPPGPVRSVPVLFVPHNSQENASLSFDFTSRKRVLESYGVWSGPSKLKAMLLITQRYSGI